MKILFLSSYTTNNEIPLLSQCKSGFGYMTYDIAKGVAKTERVDALLLNYRYASFVVDNIHFKENSISSFLRNIFHCCSPWIVFCLWRKYRMSIRSLVRIIYCWLASGRYYQLIKKENYDIVHIHGCEFYNEIYQDIFSRVNQKYVVTLHGLNSFSEIIDLEPAGKRYERDFLGRVVKGEFSITVISSGIKKTIQNHFCADKCDNISVICNSFSFEVSGKTQDVVDVRAKYHIPENAKIVLYVGNVSRNKNQEQLIRVFDLLPTEIKDTTYVLFCGRNIEAGYLLDDMVNTSASKKHLVLCGNIDKELMPCYFKQADSVALLSKAEGFGLSLIEGMHFGLPCMTFEDLDAFEDIYDENAVVALSSRDDKTVAEGLQRLVTSEWDKEKIILHSRKFENKAMTDNYINQYKEIVYGR